MNTLDVLKFIKSENKLESKININNCEFNVTFKGCYYIYINDVLKHFNIKKTDFTKVIKTIQKVIKLKKIDNLESVDKKDIYLSCSDKCIKTLKRINKYLESIQDQDQFIQCTDITFFKELSQEELDKIPLEETIEIKSIIDSSNKWINIKYLSEVVTKCCDYISTHLTNELSYLLYSKYSLEDAKDKSYDIDSKCLVFLKQDLIQLPETKDLGLEETLTKYKELMKNKTITDPVLVTKLKYLVASKGPVSKCTLMSPVILPYEDIEHQEFNLTEHGIKLKDIKEIFKIADTANTFVCDQELWNKIVSYDYSGVAKPKVEKVKKEPKPKVEKPKKETKSKVKKEVKIEEEKPEEPKQEEVKVEEEKPVEEKPKTTKKKTTKKTTRVKRETKPKAKKEEPKVEMKEMSEADILNSISVDTSVLELDDVRQDFNLE